MPGKHEALDLNSSIAPKQNTILRIGGVPSLYIFRTKITRLLEPLCDITCLTYSHRPVRAKQANNNNQTSVHQKKSRVKMQILEEIIKKKVCS
jgi:hypothetical protein